MKRSEFHFICALLWFILSYHVDNDLKELAALFLALGHMVISISINCGWLGFTKETPHEE